MVDHLVEHVAAGKLVSTEADAFWMPDTAGTDYHRQHTAAWAEDEARRSRNVFAFDFHLPGFSPAVEVCELDLISLLGHIAALAAHTGQARQARMEAATAAHICRQRDQVAPVRTERRSVAHHAEHSAIVAIQLHIAQFFARAGVERLDVAFHRAAAATEQTGPVRGLDLVVLHDDAARAEGEAADLQRRLRPLSAG